MSVANNITFAIANTSLTEKEQTYKIFHLACLLFLLVWGFTYLGLGLAHFTLLTDTLFYNVYTLNTLVYPTYSTLISIYDRQRFRVIRPSLFLKNQMSTASQRKTHAAISMTSDHILWSTRNARMSATIPENASISVATRLKRSSFLLAIYFSE